MRSSGPFTPRCLSANDPPPFPFSRAVLLAGVAIVAGCTVGPDYKQPDKPQEQGFTPEPLALQTASVPDVHGGAAQTFEPGRDIPGDWWTLFGSEELTALVREALSANPDIDAYVRWDSKYWKKPKCVS